MMSSRQLMYVPVTKNSCMGSTVKSTLRTTRKMNRGHLLKHCALLDFGTTCAGFEYIYSQWNSLMTFGDEKAYFRLPKYYQFYITIETCCGFQKYIIICNKYYITQFWYNLLQHLSVFQKAKTNNKYHDEVVTFSFISSRKQIN